MSGRQYFGPCRSELRLGFGTNFHIASLQRCHRISESASLSWNTRCLAIQPCDLVDEWNTKYASKYNKRAKESCYQITDTVRTVKQVQWRWKVFCDEETNQIGMAPPFAGALRLM